MPQAISSRLSGALSMPKFRPRGRCLRGFFLFTLQFWVSVAITGFFALMMFMLWKREVGERYSVKGLGISPEFIQATWIDYAQYMWVEQGGKRIGVYALTVQRDEVEGIYELAIRSRLKINVLNNPMPIRLEALVVMDNRLVMDTFQGRLNAANETIGVEAFTQGLELYYRVEGPPVFVPDGSLAARSDLQRPVILADAIRPLVTRERRLKVGETWSTRASDPFTGQLDMTVTVRVEAEEPVDVNGITFRAFRVVEETKDASTTSWYNANGEILKTDLGNGLVLIRADREAAFENYAALKVPPNFLDIEKAPIMAQAAETRVAGGQNPLAWFPKL
jgi:hypothetical protein